MKNEPKPTVVENPEGAAMRDHLPEATRRQAPVQAENRPSPLDGEHLAMQPVMAALAAERLTIMMARKNGTPIPGPTRARKVNRYRARMRDPMIPRDENGKDLRRPGRITRLVSAQDAHGYEDDTRIREFQAYDAEFIPGAKRTRFGVWMDMPAEAYAERVMDKSVDGAFDASLGLERAMQMGATAAAAAGLSSNPVYVSPDHGSGH